MNDFNWVLFVVEMTPGGEYPTMPVASYRLETPTPAPDIGERFIVDINHYNPRRGRYGRDIDRTERRTVVVESRSVRVTPGLKEDAHAIHHTLVIASLEPVGHISTSFQNIDHVMTFLESLSKTHPEELAQERGETLLAKLEADSRLDRERRGR